MAGSNFKIKIFITALTLIVSFAEKTHASTSQLHAATGMISGSYAGVLTTTFSISQAVNIEYELFKKSTESNFFKTTFAIDPETGKMVYYGAFTGGRYYVYSTGMIFNSSDTKNSVRSVPTWRFYGGWDLGISQVVVENVGASLTVISTLFDMGGHAGMIYQVGNSWGIEAKYGMSYGYGFSTVSVTGTATTAFLGITIYMK